MDRGFWWRKEYDNRGNCIFTEDSVGFWVRKEYDETSSILEWSSEEVVVPYVSPVDNRYHRYFVDFWMKYKDKNGEIKSVLIEVKPDIQTRPPVRKNTPNGKPTRRFINEVMTWGVNQAKWEAATKYSIERNWEFKIITDKDLR